jgi:DNA-binding NarL/FixJ family response regulator
VVSQDQPPVRVLVVDDSDVYRYALCAVVAATPGFEVAGAASSGVEALDLIDFVVTATSPQLVLLDVLLPGLDGIEVAREIWRRHPEMVVVLLSTDKQMLREGGPLAVEDKLSVSSRWLIDLWQRHSES